MMITKIRQYLLRFTAIISRPVILVAILFSIFALSATMNAIGGTQPATAPDSSRGSQRQTLQLHVHRELLQDSSDSTGSTAATGSSAGGSSTQSSTNTTITTNSTSTTTQGSTDTTSDGSVQTPPVTSDPVVTPTPTPKPITQPVCAPCGGGGPHTMQQTAVMCPMYCME